MAQAYTEYLREQTAELLTKLIDTELFSDLCPDTKAYSLTVNIRLEYNPGEDVKLTANKEVEYNALCEDI